MKCIIIASIFIILLFSTGCKKSSPLENEEVFTKTALLNWSGDYAVDGCGFFITLDSTLYKPENEQDIGDEFKSFKMFVKIKFVYLNKKIKYYCGDSPGGNEIEGIRIISIESVDSIVVRKPNIYIYPSEDLQLNVKLHFPAGGNVTESEPHYDNGWDVIVSKDGKINNEHHYLYYECNVPDLTQKEFGWVISKNELENFFRKNLSESGFNELEIKDFIDYWIPLLKDYNYYEIYPQYNSVMENMIVIEFSKVPDNIFRLSYVIKGSENKNLNLKPLHIEKADRTGFSVLEWGVILK